MEGEWNELFDLFLRTLVVALATYTAREIVHRAFATQN